MINVITLDFQRFRCIARPRRIEEGVREASRLPQSPIHQATSDRSGLNEIQTSARGPLASTGMP
jgi:hypothetical protein